LEPVDGDLVLSDFDALFLAEDPAVLERPIISSRSGTMGFIRFLSADILKSCFRVLYWIYYTPIGIVLHPEIESYLTQLDYFIRA
jgi:hypothetical protein